MSIFGFYSVYRKNISFFDNKVNRVLVDSEEDLLKNANGLYNDIIILESDITLTKGVSIGSKEKPFSGMFIGNGHKITINSRQVSLFNYISESAKISRLNLEYENTRITEENFGLFASINYGEIKDCYVRCQNICLVKNKKFSAIAVQNYGTISNVYVDFSIDKVENIRPTTAGVACENYGEIKNTIVHAKFRNFEEVDALNVNSGKVNSRCSSVCTKNEGIIHKDNCYGITNKDTITSDRRYITIKYDSEEVDLYTEEFIYNQLGFDEEIWMIDSNGIKLIGE